MDPNVSKWIPMYTNGFQWIPMDPNGSKFVCDDMTFVKDIKKIVKNQQLGFTKQSQ